MKEKRFLVALGALSAALVACSSSVGGDDDMGDHGDGDGPVGTAGWTGTAGGGPGPAPGTGGVGSPGSGGAASPGAGTGNGPSTGGNTPGGVTPTCTPGIPATSQIPRLLNRQYEAAVRDLLGVTTIGTSGQTASQLLLPDTDGDMTPDAWRIYQDTAAQIAKAVMSGTNKSKFISCSAADAACMDSTIKTFGRKAFRRPLTDAEVARFKKLGEMAPAGTSPDEIAEATLQAFLVSPSFLMIPEVGTTPAAGGTGIQVTPHEIASRLSFLLWGSVPDDTLNAAADANELQTKEQVLAQAKRMVAVRERTGPLIASFHREWAQMNNNAAHWWKMDHDKTKFPSYDPMAKVSWQAELNAFFEEVAFTNGTFKDILLSNVAFVNKDNAAIYGLNAADYGTELKKVELTDPNNPRPGFMTRAGFLSSYANYDATSPILRGAFILSYLAGANPGPPIEGADKAKVEGDFKTQREYIQALTGAPPCSGCHNSINPPGYVLEHYDAMGKLQKQDLRGGAIDASVTTATVDFGNGKKEISSPVQLMQEIASLPKAQQIYTQAWVAYAFGRSPNANDQCVVDQLKTKLSTDGYSILSLLADLTQADSFRVRVRATP